MHLRKRIKNISRTLFCLLAGLMWCVAAQAQVNAEQVLIIGRNVLSMEDYMLSIQYFNQAIKAKPYLADPYYYRGLAKLLLEDYSGAEDDCSMSIERNKFKTESYKVRGFARQRLGKDSLAVADYNVGLRYNPQDREFLFYKAVAQTEMKNLAGADSTFATLLRYYPQYEDGYTARGYLRLEQRDTVGALADLDRATQLSHTLINAYLLRAQINSQQKNWGHALADITAAIKLHPQDVDLYINRAYVRYNMDDYFGAMADYNYTLELEPSNVSALFNRALLRYEVKDLERASVDFKKVLSLEPNNFHALYNLGLVDMERNAHKEALASFERITQRYPRFHQAYYAKAEVYRNMGNMRAAMQNVHTGDNLVRQYVKNPERNPLDRPTIAAGKTRTANRDESHSDEESDEEVMARFNQLVTVGSESAESQLSFKERIKGRVQDRNLNIEIEPSYGLSFIDSPASLRSTSNYFRELDDFNQHRYIADKIYLRAGDASLTDDELMKQMFARAEHYEGMVKEGVARPADWLALGVVRTMLKNYDGAIDAINRSIQATPDLSLGYMARAYARQNELKHNKKDAIENRAELMQIVTDYDKALALNPRLVYAWFNKGNLYSAMKDYTSAIQCYGEALRLDPTFGAAWFNRGVSYLQTGNKRQAFVDLSKAGEHGVIASYNLLKRMK